MAFEKEIAQFYRFQRSQRLEAVRGSIMNALARGDDVTALRADLTALEAMPEYPAGDGAAMIAQWPPGFAALPQYITDPAGARAAEDKALADMGLVRSGDLVVNVSAQPDDVIIGELDPMSEAAVIARRLDRKAVDDANKAAFDEMIARRRAKETSAQALERKLGFPIANLRKLIGLDP